MNASRTVLITGASDGIGRALVDRYQRDGWSVIAHGRRTRDEISPPLPESVEYLRHPFPDGVAELVSTLPERLDLAILNAGVGRVAAAAATEPDEIAEMVGVNVVAPLRLAHALHSRLAAAAGGTLVFIGSTSARGAQRDFAVYAATKAAIAEAARSLRLEWDGSVDVRIIHPGPTATDMHDKAGLAPTRLRRFFTPPAIVADAIADRIEARRAATRLGPSFFLRHAVGGRHR